MNLKNNIDKSGFWQTIKTNVVYKTRWLEVRDDDVKDPNGNNAKYSYIIKQDFVSAIVLDENDSIYLVGQHRYPINNYTWEVVQGGVEKGESSIEAVKREVREEVGVIAESYEEIFTDFIASGSTSNARGSIFLVRGIKQEVPQSLDPSEKINIKKIPFKEVVNKVLEGEIKDLPSCFAILLAAKKLGY